MAPRAIFELVRSAALVVVLFCLNAQSVLITVNLTQHWPNYLVPVRTPDRKYRNLVVDTGNAQLQLLSRGFKFNNKTEIELDTAQCLALQEDFSIIQFVTVLQKQQISGYCAQYRGKVSLGPAMSTVNFTVATNISIQNPLLHPWVSPNLDGDIGLAYCNSVTGTCSTAQTTSPFFEILANKTGRVNSTNERSVFGLDFWTTPLQPSGVAGSMQLGGVLSKYTADIMWGQQTTDTPTYHEAFLSEVKVCGVDLLSGIGVSSWPMLVDTGVACAALPAQIYDMFVAWFDASPVPDTSNMPALTFGIEGSKSTSGQSTLYLPLSSLLVNASVFKAGLEPGAPEIVVGGVKQKLCLLRNSDAFSTPVPRIILGALALRSLYFAADVGTFRVGLANKISPASLIDHISNDKKRCRARTVCVGHQSFSSETNTCVSPSCR